MIPEALFRPLREARRLLLTSHQSPDGDAIGTEMGLARILRAAGRDVTVWNHHPTPPVYRALPGADEIHVGAEPPAGFPHAGRRSSGAFLARLEKLPWVRNSARGSRA